MCGPMVQKLLSKSQARAADADDAWPHGARIGVRPGQLMLMMCGLMVQELASKGPARVADAEMSGLMVQGLASKGPARAADADDAWPHGAGIGAKGWARADDADDAWPHGAGPSVKGQPMPLKLHCRTERPMVFMMFWCMMLQPRLQSFVALCTVTTL